MRGRLGSGARSAFRLAVRRADRTRREVDEELQLHIELRVAQLTREGWPPAEAEAEARRRFGPSWQEAVRHLHEAGQAREERLAMRERLDSLRYDLRYAMRGLARSPRYTLAALLTLALGIGAATAIFTLVDHIVLRPLPFAQPERLAIIREEIGSLKSVYPSLPANASHYLAWRRDCAVCEGVAAVKRAAVTLTGPGDPQRLGAARVSSNTFALLGVRPALGRDFREEEDVKGREHVAIISDAMWRREFGGDAAVVGRTVMLDGTSTQIVGVLPRATGVPGGDALGDLVGLPVDIDVYKPLALTEQERNSRGDHDYAVIARLRPGATLDALQAQIDAIQQRFVGGRGPEATLQAVVTPLQGQVIGGARRPLLLLLSAVGAVLLIVCVNLANLSLARSVGRQRESAVRVALGAGAGRLARLALIECLLLSLAGGVLGLLLAAWGLGVLVGMAPVTLPRLNEVVLDGRVVGVALLLSVVVGLLVGALPAWRAGHTHPAEALKAGGRAASGGRAAGRRRALFIASQVSFSTLLLVGTGWFLASFLRVLRVDPGVDRDRVVALDVALPLAEYPMGVTRWAYYERALAEVAAVPGIATAAMASALPLEGETSVNDVARAESPEGRDAATANFRYVSAGYFSAVGTPLRQGRGFTADDRGQRVVVVSERTAARLWPGEPAVGKRVRAGGGETAEVVGVAAEARTSTLEAPGSLVVYIPAWEAAPSRGVIVARTTGAASQTALTAVRAALRRVDPRVPVPKMRTMDEVVSGTVAERRFQAALLALFAVLALLTASVGIYGVIAQSLASRTREIGVRMALGAQPGDVHRLVVREGMTPVVVGLAVGVVASLAVGRVVASLLFEVKPGDPALLAAVLALLAAVAFIACVIPARRAARGRLATMLSAE